MGETKSGQEARRNGANNNETSYVERSIRHLRLLPPLPSEKQTPITRLPDSGNIVVFPIQRIKSAVPERSKQTDAPPTKASIIQAIRWRATVKRVALAKEQGQPKKTIEVLPTDGLYEYYQWEINNALHTLEGQVARLREQEAQMNQREGATVRILGIPQSQRSIARLHARSEAYESRVRD